MDLVALCEDSGDDSTEGKRKVSVVGAAGGGAKRRKVSNVGSIARAADPASSSPAPAAVPTAAAITAGSSDTLSSLGFPPEVESFYSSKGLHQLYPWQAQCLSLPGVSSLERSLVYSAPTSGGKTLVAELLMVQAMLAQARGEMTKAIFVLPFVSLVEEKERELRKLFEGVLRKRVKGFYSWRQPTLEFDVAVCTFEKALMLVNLLHRERQLADVVTVVVDELHMISEAGRGYLLEVLLTKLRMYHRHRCLTAQQARQGGPSGSDGGGGGGGELFWCSDSVDASCLP
jgi:DNA polymerase theta